jgi:carbamoyl-phosphate synthase large subunit
MVSVKDKLNVLVFPGGTEIAMEIWKSLKDCKDIRLYSTGSDISCHSEYVFARNFKIASIYEENWLDNLNQIILEHHIDYVFPAHDDVIIALVDNADKLKARIVTSPASTCRITRMKRLTYKTLSGIVPVPIVYERLDLIDNYPVFAKPDKGEGSRDVHIVYSRGQLDQLLGESREYIITEFLPGDEFTIDCFSDRESGLLFSGGRQRIRTRSGISMNSRPVYEELFQDYARAISSKLDFHGTWFFQMKKDRRGMLKLLEIAPRVAGTMATHRVLGINFALLSIYEQERIPMTILLNTVDMEIDRALVNRYSHRVKYKVVYVDLDDSLILNDCVNLSLVQFLYQCINERVRIVLLTKHDGDVKQTLRKYRLSEVFDEIVQIEKTARKSDYIMDSDAILIDDSFSERKAVHDKLGILTFDCSMIEMLINERA